MLKSVRLSLLPLLLLVQFQNCSPPLHSGGSIDSNSTTTTCEPGSQPPSSTRLLRLSNAEYTQILKDLASDKFTSAFDPNLPELPAANGFDNQISLSLDSHAFEFYFDRAENYANELLGSAIVMNSCPQSLPATSRNWDNCALPVVMSVGEKLYRRPLRREEIETFKNKFESIRQATKDLVTKSPVSLMSYFDRISSGSGESRAFGWAFDPAWPERAVEVHFYIKEISSNAKAVFIGATIANVVRSDVNQVFNVPGNHGFEFVIPPAFANGKSYEITAYSIGGLNKMVSNSPVTFSMTEQKAVTNDRQRYPNEFLEGLSGVFMAMLTSPNFLYKPEFIPNGFSIEEQDFAKASRLSFLTRSSFADQALFDLAKKKSLTPEKLIGEVERNLYTYRGRFSMGFAGQWLNFREGFRDVSPQIRSMATESHLVFIAQLANDEKPEGLLRPGFTYVNSIVAQEYGMNTAGSDFTKIVTNKRGGLLDQGHFLMTTATAAASNPVQRGLWVMDKILCRSLPPLQQATLEEIAQAAKEIDPSLPLEDRIAKHRERGTNCYSCHSQIDPLGLPLEKFDQFGHERADWSIKPIVFGSTTIRDPASLQTAILETSEFDHCITKKLKAYITGGSSNTAPNSTNSICDADLKEFEGSTIKERTKRLLMREIER